MPQPFQFPRLHQYSASIENRAGSCLTFRDVMKRKVSETKTTIKATCSLIFKATVHSPCTFQRKAQWMYKKVQPTMKPRNTGVITFAVNTGERTSHANETVCYEGKSAF